MKINNRQIPITYIIIAILIGVAIFQFVLLIQLKKNNSSEEVASNSARDAECSYEIDRSSGFRFIKPIIDAKKECESEKYLPVKQDITQLIESYKSKGEITSASVYLQDFAQNEWISYNSSEKYNPGSLLKVPLLIAYLRMAENQPGLLDAQLAFDKHYNFDKNPVFLSKAIEFGKRYSVRELLRYTIVYSDNNANNVLFDHVDGEMFKKVFTDLGIPAPDWGAANYPLTTKQYSVFMDAIFNASYLSPKDSEFASELLSETDFKEGVRKYLPSSLIVLHKFAEAGNPTQKEFHESAIIYLNKSPYLITIMTKGPDLQKLPEVLASLSKAVYDDMIRLNVAG